MKEIIMAFMWGCLICLGGVSIYVYASSTQNDRVHNVDQYGGYNLVVIDSCEYLQNAKVESPRFNLTHKGNCKFCLERNKK